VLAAPLKKKMAIAPPTQRVALTANTRDTKYKPPQSQPEVAITRRSIGSLPIVITHLPEVCSPMTKTNNQVWTGGSPSLRKRAKSRPLPPRRLNLSVNQLRPSCTKKYAPAASALSISGTTTPAVLARRATHMVHKDPPTMTVITDTKISLTAKRRKMPPQ